MKKLLSFILAAIMIFAIFSALIQVGAQTVKYGDVNDDDVVNLKDATLIRRYYVGGWNVDLDKTTADVNCDDVVNLKDATLVRRYYVGGWGVVLGPQTPTAESLVSGFLVDPTSGWSKYDKLIDAIRSETNAAHRAELMHEAEDILMATHCVVPLYYYNDLYLQKNYVTGVYSNPYGTKYFMYSNLGSGAASLRINLASEPWSVDPALNSSVDGACLIANSFSGLYTYNDKGVCVPACADGYTLSADGKTYTVTLKEGLKWSDGSPLTAADFEYSWKRAASEATAADYAYMFSGFAGYPNDLAVTAKDDVTLEFTLASPCGYTEDLMAFPTFFPVKKAAVESADGWESEPGAWCNDAPFVSNGAYVCTGWDHGNTMTYEKNPYWYDAGNVSVEKLVFVLSEDGDALYSAYEAGELDFLDNFPSDKVSSLLGTSELHTVDELGTYYLAFNAKSSVFEGKTPAEAACVREALSILIDREYICENVGGIGQVAANSFIPLGMADGAGGLFKENAEDGYFDIYKNDEEYKETLEHASTLLKAAGYKFGDDGKLSSETPITIEYLTNASAGHIAIAEVVRQSFAEIGVGMTLRTVGWSDFSDEMQSGNFDVVRGGWVADFNDPINMLEMWTTDSGNNSCQFGR